MEKNLTGAVRKTVSKSAAIKLPSLSALGVVTHQDPAISAKFKKLMSGGIIRVAVYPNSIDWTSPIDVMERDCTPLYCKGNVFFPMYVVTHGTVYLYNRATKLFDVLCVEHWEQLEFSRPTGFQLPAKPSLTLREAHDCAIAVAQFDNANTVQAPIVPVVDRKTIAIEEKLFDLDEFAAPNLNAVLPPTKLKLRKRAAKLPSGGGKKTRAGEAKTTMQVPSALATGARVIDQQAATPVTIPAPVALPLPDYLRNTVPAHLPEIWPIKFSHEFQCFHCGVTDESVQHADFGAGLFCSMLDDVRLGITASVASTRLDDDAWIDQLFAN